jgi:hypothetical protein
MIDFNLITNGLIFCGAGFVAIIILLVLLIGWLENK